MCINMARLATLYYLNYLLKEMCMSSADMFSVMDLSN
jgi:hypothetical protein